MVGAVLYLVIPVAWFFSDHVSVSAIVYLTTVGLTDKHNNYDS